MALVARAFPDTVETIILQFIRTNFVEFGRGLGRPTLKSVVLMLPYSMIAEDFESLPQRILAEAELEFSKGGSSHKTANRRPRMRHVRDQTRKSIKGVSQAQHC
jgi:hypothetical protein